MRTLIFCCLIGTVLCGQSLLAQTQIPDTLRGITISTLTNFEEQLENRLTQFENRNASSIITAQDIVERGYDNLDEILSSVQGVFITHDRNTTQIGFRGLSPESSNNQRILLTLDGIPLNDPLTGAAASTHELRAIAVEDIREIVIIRSPSSVMYGPGAMSGIIHIRTWNGTNGSRITGDLGNFGELETSLNLSNAFDKFAITAGGKVQDFIGQNLYYPEFSDTIVHADEGQYRGLNVGVQTPKLSIHARYSERAGSIVQPIDDSMGIYGRGFIDDRLLYTNVAFRSPIKDNQFITTNVYVNYADGSQLLRAIGDSSTFQQGYNRGLWLGISYQHFLDLDEHQLMWGLDTRLQPFADNYYENTQFGFTEIIDSSVLAWGYWNLGVVLQDFYQVSEQFSIRAGVRIGVNSFARPQFAPELDIHFVPFPQTDIALSYGRGYRLPGLSETELDNDFRRIPNPSLGPETFQQIDLSWKQLIREGLELTLNVYGQRLDSLIGINGIPALNGTQLSNLDAILNSGIEGGITVDLLGQSRTYLAYNFPIASTYAFNFPSPICKFGVTVPFLRHFTFYTEGQYEGGRLTLSEKQSLPYFLLNANLLIQPDIRTRGVIQDILSRSNLSFRVYNILNQYYQHPSPVGVINPFVVQNGRNWQAQATIRF